MDREKFKKLLDKKNLVHVAAVILVLVGMMAFVSIFSTMTFSIEALQCSLSVHFHTQGVTQLEIPPLGVVRAHTHLTPVKIVVRLENIDLQLLKDFISELPQQEKVIAGVRDQGRRIITLFVLKLMGLAALGGAFGIFLLRRLDLPAMAKGALGGLVLGLALLAGTYFTYDTREFRNPEYEGVLRVAPRMINFAEEALGKIETLSQKMEVVATNLYDFFEQIEQIKPLTDTGDEIRALHVSDLHNNPAGMEFIQKVAQLFNVHFIIDTGDISDFGTPLEALLLDQLQTIGRPYLFVAGNHDSPDIISHIEQIPAVTVLNGLTELHGIRIMGLPDPTSFTNDVTPPSLDMMPEYVNKVKERLAGTEITVDILAVHNHHIATRLAGTAPVILCGHNHRLWIEEKKGSIIINAGSSGASGLRGLQSLKTPYSLVLLHFKKLEGEIKLVAADSITVYNARHGFTLERKVFQQEEGEPAMIPPQVR